MTEKENKRNELKRFEVNEIFCNVDDSLLGRGNYGKVMLGHHRLLGVLAIKCQKVVSPGMDDAKKKELLKEAELLSLASHKHVVRIEGCVEWEGWFGVVMELMQGGSLHDLVFNKELQSIPPSLLLRMSYEMADAITYLHSIFVKRRIAHGDLKPQNVLLTSDFHCKIADFGGASLAPHSISINVRPDRTGEGKHWTPLFTAPERFTPGCVRLTTAMDVFSFGVIIYVIIVRQYPPVAFWNPSLMTQIKETLRSINMNEECQIISVLERIMMQCVRHNAPERPTMMQIRDDVRKHFKSIKDEVLMRNIADVLEFVSIRKDNLNGRRCFPINEAMCEIGAEGTSAQQEYGGNEDDKFFLKYSQSQQMHPKLPVENCSEAPASSNEAPIAGNVMPDCHGILENVQSLRNMLSHKNFDDATKYCNELIDVINSACFSENDAKILVDDVINLSVALRKSKSYVTSLKLVDCVGGFCRYITQSLAKLELLQRCAWEFHVTAQEIKAGNEFKEAGCNHVIICVSDLLFNTSSVNCDEYMKLKTKLTCWFSMTSCYDELKRFDDAIKVNEQMLETLESLYGDESRKMIAYTLCCNNIGGDYEAKYDVDRAAKYYLKSLSGVGQVRADEREQGNSQAISCALTHICKLWENHPSMTKVEVEEVFSNLKENYDLESFLNLTILSLRLALLLDHTEDARMLLGRLLRTKASPTSRECFDLCINVRDVTIQLFACKEHDSAISLLHHGMNWSKSVSSSNGRIHLMCDFSHVIRKQLNNFSTSQCPMFASQFIPLCKEMIDRIRNERNVDEEIRLKYLSLCLMYLSCHLLQVEDFKEALEAANEALRLLPLNVGHDQSRRSSCEGLMYYYFGFASCQLEDYDHGEPALLRAIQLWEGNPQMEINLNNCRRNVEFFKGKKQKRR